MNKGNIKNARNFDELLDLKYGKIGVQKRDEFQDLKMANVTFNFLHFIEFLNLDLANESIYCLDKTPTANIGLAKNWLTN